MTPSTNLAELLRGMQPVLNPGVYAFCVVPDDASLVYRPLATFREAEGVTVIVEEAVAAAHGLTPLFRAAWITLTVNSDLAAVGLTAAVSRALADAGSVATSLPPPITITCSCRWSGGATLSSSCGVCRLRPRVYGPDALAVELVSASGRTQALVTLKSSDVRACTDHDLLSVRPVA